MSQKLLAQHTQHTHYSAQCSWYCSKYSTSISSDNCCQQQSRLHQKLKTPPETACTVHTAHWLRLQLHCCFIHWTSCDNCCQHYVLAIKSDSTTQTVDHSRIGSVICICKSKACSTQLTSSGSISNPSSTMERSRATAVKCGLPHAVYSNVN